jgi:D-3-phosphoglycerate dehydrogenase / 2-oxoglutarate reductase
MGDWSKLQAFRVVRLNAELFPPSAYERDLCRQYHLSPIEVEANTPADIIPWVADCDALFAISVALPAAVVAKLDRCRVISRLGTGTDKIAVDLATQRGILVTNVPYFCVEEQADHTLALLLSLARQIPAMSKAMAAGEFGHARNLSRVNQRLDGRTLGLVGFGNSARQVAQRARGFGLRVIATRRNRAASDRAAQSLGVQMVDLDTVLRESDYVSLHLPLTPETRHLIDDQALRKMKPGAFLINTARGALVDEAALVLALREGRLGGAGLDTFEQIDVFTPNEAPPLHPLLELDNVVLTPHVAAGSVQSGQAVSRGGIENVVSILSGHWPLPENIVNQGVVPRYPLHDYDPTFFETGEAVI